MRFAKLTKSACIIASCILIGVSPVYAEKVSYSEILSPGSSYDMSDLNSEASRYSWSVSGNTSDDTIIGPDGTLLVGSDEEAKTLIIAATSLRDSGSTSQYYIKIDPSVSRVSSTHASDVVEAAHMPKQAKEKKEKKSEVDFSSMNRVISAYKNLDTSACSKSDIKKMDDFVKTAKQYKGYEDVSQDQIDAFTSRLTNSYNILEQQAFNALPFYERYMKQLIIGCAAGIGTVILLLVLMNILRKSRMERDPAYASRVRAQAEQKAMLKQQKRSYRQTRTNRVQSNGVSPAGAAPGYQGVPGYQAMPGYQIMPGYQGNPYNSGYPYQNTSGLSSTYRPQPEPAMRWGQNAAQQNNQNIGFNSGYREANEGDEATTLLTNEEETSLLGAGTTGLLVSQNTQDQYYITKPETIIGKERQKVDICVANDPTISRRHCSIVMRNGTFYLTDLHSSNGTYFSGRRLAPEQPVELQDGDRFTISDQTFLFHVNNKEK